MTAAQRNSTTVILSAALCRIPFHPQVMCRRRSWTPGAPIFFCLNDFDPPQRIGESVRCFPKEALGLPAQTLGNNNKKTRVG
jgi:hypothetical protein